VINTIKGIAGQARNDKGASLPAPQKKKDLTTYIVYYQKVFIFANAYFSRKITNKYKITS
jgi:hypothetical protein